MRSYCLEVGLALRANLAAPVGVWLRRVLAVVPDPVAQVKEFVRHAACQYYQKDSLFPEDACDNGSMVGRDISARLP